jgi:hypothetical protein
MKMFVTLCAALLSSGAIAAEVHTKFIEGAPKDRFAISYTGTCTMENVEITIDLSTAPAGLIFDVTGTGAGVDVFQPFELTAGHDLISNPPQVEDGDQSVTLRLTSLAEGQGVDFTIDVDDTEGTRPTMISDAEITGAAVTVVTANGSAQGTFDGTAAATVRLPNC